MASGWKMKKGDLLPILDVVLRDSQGAVNLSGATSATFKMSTPQDVADNSAPKIDAVAAIDGDQGANPGKVTYTWTSGDTDTIGTFWAEIVVLYTSKTITYPNGGYYIVEILEDVDN